jgi:amidase
MKRFALILLLFLVCSCKYLNDKNSDLPSDDAIVEKTSDTLNVLEDEMLTDSTGISAISGKDFREFKVLDSKYINVPDLWNPFAKDLESFSEVTYNSLKSHILEQDIPTIQKHIKSSKLSYELLVKFYLYRIRKFDRNNAGSLNSVISLNPNIISEAKQKDLELRNKKVKHPIFGMPILLKDNIDASGMSTTAGAVALKYNDIHKDAFIVTQLKEKGALILGKTNLSEWAYFFCGDCPSGYSAIGGQTLNPYGRKIMDTGGSSSGSGVAVAANFCVAAVGTETSGSILSPSSQNSIVGFKPTVGLMSRSGIVPISSTLDTPGPMTKNVMDNALLMDAMFGPDEKDNKSIDALLDNGFYYEKIVVPNLKGKRFGYFEESIKDSLFTSAIEVLKNLGAEMVELKPETIELPDFLRLLNLDMKKDLPIYLKASANDSVMVTSVKDVIEFNKSDSINIMPYGQKLFEGILADKGTNQDLEAIKSKLKKNGQLFFDTPMKANNLNAILSINNYHAGFAAVAEYPAITVPMGYSSDKNAPKGLTFIGKRLNEKFLLQWAYAYERASKMRKMPDNYN